MTTTAAPLVPGEVQFFDAVGAPLKGGLLYTYIPATTTPKATWQDSGQVAPNVNPITLDDAGRAVVFGSGQYRLMLFDSTGALVWDNAGEATDPNYVASLLPVFVGDSGAGGVQGLVPAPVAGAAAAQQYLRADGTWGGLLVSVAFPPSPIQAGFLYPPLRAITFINPKLFGTDAGGVVTYGNVNATGLTIQNDATVPWPSGVVTQVMVYNLIGSGALTLTEDSGVSLLWPGSSATPGNRVLAANGQALLSRIGANLWTVIGAGLS